MLIKRDGLSAKLNDLMRKPMETRVAHGLENEHKGERFTLIDPARFPEKPFKPNRLAIILIGFVLGCGAGVGFAALKEFSDHSVRKASRLSFLTALPVLAEIPEIVTRKDILRRRLRRVGMTLMCILIISSGVTTFHYQVMDLDVFKAKVFRKLDKYQLLPDFLRD